MDPEKNKERIREWVEQGWNEGEVWIADDLFSPDYHALDHETGKHIKGPAGISAFVRMWREQHPDIHFEIDALIAEGDLVAGIFTITGVRVAEGSGAATKTLWAADVWRFGRDGKISQRLRATVQDKP